METLILLKIISTWLKKNTEKKVASVLNWCCWQIMMVYCKYLKCSVKTGNIDWLDKIEKWEKSKVFDCAMCYMIWFPSLRQVWSATGAIGASKTGIARLKSQIGFYMSILWKKVRYLINLLRNDTRLQ